MTNEMKDNLRCECGQSFNSKEELQQHQRTCPAASQQRGGGKTRGAGGGQMQES
jgi:hypothetical protein